MRLNQSKKINIICISVEVQYYTVNMTSVMLYSVLF